MLAAKGFQKKPTNRLENEAIQPRLKIGQPDDKYEKEADLVADAVMRMPDPQMQMQSIEEEEEQLQMQPKQSSQIQMKHQVPELQRMCPRCRERVMQGKPLDCPDCEKKLQMTPAIQRQGNGQTYASPEISNQLHASKGQGAPLPSEVQQEMSHKMGADFSGINIHTDSQSHQLNNQLGARAFTHGRDIYFNRGEYNPTSNDGKHLLVHELTHVVQQKSNNSLIQRIEFIGGPTISQNWITLINLIRCLNPVVDEMGPATSRYLRRACRDENHLTSLSGVEFIPEDRADAFGHCWIACEGTKICGESGTAFLGAGREYFREAMKYLTIGLWGHNSFTEDVHNQEVGRSLAVSNPNTDTFDLCYQAITNGSLLFHGEHTGSDPESPRVYNCRAINLDGRNYQQGWQSIPQQYLERY